MRAGGRTGERIGRIGRAGRVPRFFAPLAIISLCCAGFQLELRFAIEVEPTYDMYSLDHFIYELLFTFLGRIIGG